VIYKNIITAIDKYNETSKEIVTANIHRLLVDRVEGKGEYKAAEIAEQIGISPQTIWGWNKRKHGSKPKFEAAIKLCDLLEVDIKELVKDIGVSEVMDDRPMCKTEGCNNPADAAGGLCWKCYQRKRRAMQFADKK
jgi:DNA-binding XRE family transcriptional regulator